MSSATIQKLKNLWPTMARQTLVLRSASWIIVAFSALSFSTAGWAQERQPWPVEAKLRLEKVAQCIVETSEQRAARLMNGDFTSSSYESGLKRLASDNRGCWRENRLRSSYGLPLAGALSEALLERDTASLVTRGASSEARQRRATLTPATHV